MWSGAIIREFRSAVQGDRLDTGGGGGGPAKGERWVGRKSRSGFREANLASPVWMGLVCLMDEKAYILRGFLKLV